MEYTIALNGNNYTMIVDYDALETFLDAIEPWEAGKYTEMYSLDIGIIAKSVFARQIDGLRALVNRIKNTEIEIAAGNILANESLIADFIINLEKINGKFIPNNGHTVAIAKDACEFLGDETWKTIELRVNIINDYTCALQFVYRLKTRK